MHPFVSLAALALTLPSPDSDSGKQAKAELTVVKLVDFKKSLKDHEGKVIVVYVWGDYSLPDIEWLADVVAMHKRLRKSIAFMTVCQSAGGRDVETRRARALRILTQKKVVLQNLLLDEDDMDVWDDNLGFVSGPTFSVYCPQGRKVKTFRFGDGEYLVADVERLARRFAPASHK